LFFHKKNYHINQIVSNYNSSIKKEDVILIVKEKN